MENFQLEAPKTKDYISILKALALFDQNSLLVIGNNDRNLRLSARNLKNARVATAESLNTYDILKAKHIILLEDAVEKIEKNLSRKTSEESL